MYRKMCIGAITGCLLGLLGPSHDRAGAQDFAEVAKDLVPKIASAVKRKIADPGMYRLAVFTPGGAHGKVTREMASPCQALQGELLYQLRTQFKAEGETRFLVLDKSGLQRQFLEATEAVDPSQITFDNPQGTGKALKALGIDAAVVGNISIDQLKTPAKPKVRVTFGVVFQDGSVTMVAKKLKMVIGESNTVVDSMDSDEENPSRRPTLHVIPAADIAHRAIGSSAERNQKHLLDTLLRISQAHVKITTLREPSGKALLASIKNLHIEQGDSILVYYLGHAHFDPKRGHVLLYDSGGEVERRLIEEGLKIHKSKAAFIGLITDAVAIFTGRIFDASDLRSYPTAPREIREIPATPSGMPVGFERLFFRSKGFVNINSCKWGQVALSNYKMGDGISDKAPFSEGFTDYLERYADSKRVDWNTLVDEVSKTTSDRFLDTFPSGRAFLGPDGEKVVQRTQDPQVIERLPGVE